MAGEKDNISNTGENEEGKDGAGQTGNTTPTPNPNPAANTSSGATPNPSQLRVDIDIKAKPTDEKRTINLLNDDELAKKVTTKTEGDVKNTGIPSPTASSSKKEMSTAELRTQLIEDSKKTANFTVEQFKQQADSMVNILDIIIVSILRAMAHDAKDSAYIIRDDKKEILKEQLKNVLIFYNAAFPIIGLFIFTLLSVYATPALNAWDNRKLWLKEKEKQKKEKADSAKTNPLKRPRGAQPKN